MHLLHIEEPVLHIWKRLLFIKQALVGIHYICGGTGVSIFFYIFYILFLIKFFFQGFTSAKNTYFLIIYLIIYPRCTYLSPLTPSPPPFFDSKSLSKCAHSSKPHISLVSQNNKKQQKNLHCVHFHSRLGTWGVE